MENKFEKDALVFKALCDGNRLHIISLLQSGEKCACVLLEKVNVVQSTLSHHMKILCESGIVKSRKDGKWTHYSLYEQGTAYAKKLLDNYTKILESEVAHKCN